MKKIFLKHKKLLVRIGSILVCLLLVAALVLPTFADDDSSEEGATMLGYVRAYIEALGLANPACDLYLNFLSTSFSDEGLKEELLATNNLVTGYVAPYQDNNPVWIDTGLYIQELDGRSDIIFTQNLDFFTAFYEYQDAQATIIADDCVFGMILEWQEGGFIVGTIYQAFAYILDPIQNSVLAGFELELKLEPANAFGVSAYSVFASFRRLYMANGEVTLVYPDGLNLALCLAYTDNTPIRSWTNCLLLNDLDTKTIDPSDYLRGYFYGDANAGGASPEELDAAYQNGYTQGEQAGLQTGYDNGYDSGYNVGFEVAAQRDFGADIIGETLSKPMEMLRDFTIVRLPSGIDITLGHVASALIALVLVLAFLKIYAGG